MYSSKYIEQRLVLLLTFVLIFLFCSLNVSAEEIDWIEVANIDNQIQLIDVNSIKYDNKGMLTVITKYLQTKPDDDNVNSNSYLMAIDCEKRLFSNLPLNAELKQENNWIKPTNDKLIKTTIINSCLY